MNLKFLLLTTLIFSFYSQANSEGNPKAFELLKIEESQYEYKIKEFLEQGINLNATNDEKANVLTVAANDDKFNLVSILLDYRVDPNLVGCRNRPALVIAVGDKNTSMVEKLVSKGANIDDRSCMNNDFPIVKAIYNNDYFMVKYLIKEGADLNQKDFDGMTVFMYLCSYSQGSDLIKLAIEENNVNFNYQEEYSGETALMWAVEKGLIENVKVLLSYKANLYARNDEGRTVFEIAQKKKFKKIYRLLKLAQRQL
ncbi:ankyrin repeat domain-containing protein [Bacteriovoracaceae bacterium]|nr:ankyrin repeat domain-containing protein [Bacteriovoracaceae bacterium]